MYIALQHRPSKTFYLHEVEINTFFPLRTKGILYEDSLLANPPPPQEH